MIWRGMPSFSAEWIWAKLGGLAMMQSATKGLAAGSEPGSFPGLRKVIAGSTKIHSVAGFVT
jgi:hypothetical protein